ncbi:hypothetical protein V5P93_003437 [Actinokineospora auranticolor]|uniref:Uncharacterized protein n=1 Tax=Actinokineospora auranticolor TaxID=155976 RepID=A0A2S6GPE2_9PSEU|nr:hypothetical protein [Actinokineospora auranticolor]PPK67098.1 hypothetical protein CLV40_10895 [Actinokineospora auranticolor]
MRLVVVPPLIDPTITPVVADDDRLVDLNELFLRRVLAPEALDALARRVPEADAVFVRAAAAVLDRAGRPDEATLRALGLVLRVVSRTDPALRLAGDDVELVEGSTESSAHVVAAAARTRLFDQETAVAAGLDGPVHLVVETDQQLPAAVAVVAVVGASNVVLCGRFARAHRAALGRVAALAGVRFADWSPRWRLGAAWSPEPVRWARHADEVVPGDRWAGWLTPADLGAVPGAAWSDCVGLTVAATRCDGDLLVGADGTAAAAPFPAPAVELLVGVPGIGVDEVTATAARLADEGRLAGIGPFRLPAGAPSHRLGHPVEIDRSPAHDLPRWTHVVGGPAGDGIDLAALVERFGARVPLYPGRFGACCLRAGTRPPWEPAAVVVDSTLVNLRTGRAFGLHPRLAPLVRRLAEGERGALDPLPEARRTTLTDQLERAGVLTPARPSPGTPLPAAPRGES